MQAFLVLKSRHTVPLGTVLREIQYCHKIVVTFCIGYGYCLNIVNVDITSSSFLLFFMCFSVPVVLKLRCDRRFPRNFSWDWINSFESCKGSSIPKRNKELSSLKKRGIRGISGNSPGIPREYETKLLSASSVDGKIATNIVTISLISLCFDLSSTPIPFIDLEEG